MNRELHIERALDLLHARGGVPSENARQAVEAALDVVAEIVEPRLFDARALAGVDLP